MTATCCRGLVAALIAGGLGCGGGEPDRPAATVKPASSAPSVPLVAHGRLMAFVPVVSGWTRGEMTGGLVTLPAAQSHVLVTYTRGPAKVDLEITDTAGQPELIERTEKVAGTAFSQKAANGYMRGTTIAGFPAIESWNRTDKLGEITVLLSRRFIVHAAGTSIDAISSVQTLVEQVDLKGLADLR